MDIKEVQFVVESIQARHERTLKRLIIALIVTIVLLFASNMAWLYYESQFDTYSYEQDGAGLNNINTGEQGDIYGAETPNKGETDTNK
jgi:hypothetical protein